MQVIYNLTTDYTKLKKDPLVTMTAIKQGFDVNLTTVPVLTEYGICYMTNNMFTKHLNAHDMIHGIYKPNLSIPDHLLTTSSAFFDDDAGYIAQNIPSSINSYIHGFGEVMNPTKSHGFQNNVTNTFFMGSIELVSEKGLKEGSSVRQRNCRYPEESNLEYYPVYTETLCQQECRLNLVNSLCNCIPHFYPKSLRNTDSNKRICHYNELKACLKDRRRVGEHIL